MQHISNIHYKTNDSEEQADFLCKNSRRLEKVLQKLDERMNILQMQGEGERLHILRMQGEGANPSYYKRGLMH
jgi:hypothetical protein